MNTHEQELINTILDSFGFEEKDGRTFNFKIVSF